MIDLTQILQAFLALIAALITTRLIPWLKARMSAEKQEMLLAITRTLVYAAEQFYGAGRGTEKLAYVQKQLKDRGFTVDLDVIEAMVRELAIDGGEADKPANPVT